jgi:hypothetical protein
VWEILVLLLLALARPILLAIIYLGYDDLANRRSTYVSTGAVAALLDSLLIPIASIPFWFYAVDFLLRPGAIGHKVLFCGSLTFVPITALCGFIGSISTFRLLGRPDVAEAFRSWSRKRRRNEPAEN